MANNKKLTKGVQTDLATMLGVMQDLCPDDETIVACLIAMMDKGVIRRPSWLSGLGAEAYA